MATDWLKRRRECKECGGSGYMSYSESLRNGWRGAVVMCKCQPHTMSELAEAAEQERARQPATVLTWREDGGVVIYDPNFDGGAPTEPWLTFDDGPAWTPQHDAYRISVRQKVGDR